MGSPLDRLFGADILIRVGSKEPKKKPRPLTFDLTVRRAKTGTKADVLIKDLPDPDLQEKEYLKAMGGAAHDAFRIYLRRSRN